MLNSDVIKEIERLKFEDFIWITFIILNLININGDNNEIKYLETNNSALKYKADKIFETTLTVTFFIYIYFFVRNYNAYKKVSEKQKKLYATKLFGSSLLIAGILCLLYFQKKETSFIGAPAL